MTLNLFGRSDRRPKSTRTHRARPQLERLEDRLAPAGGLDPTFGIGGKVITDFGRNDIATSMALQADGKIVAAGFTNSGGSGSNFALARYNPDGTLDTSFSLDGKVATDFAGQSDEAHSVAIQPDGKIVVAGTAGYDFALARYNPDGTLDSSFGTNGKATTDFVGQSDEAHSVAIQPDGKIVVAGSAQLSPGDIRFALARYNPDGTPDPTFGAPSLGSGKIVVGPTDNLSRATSMLLRPDGSIVVAGTTGTGIASDFALAFCGPNGSLVGWVVTDFLHLDAANSLALQADGKIVAAGIAILSGDAGTFVALARYNPDGTLDSNFDADGKVVTDFFGPREEAAGVAIQANGKVVIAGTAFLNTTNAEFALARYNSDGTLDTGFCFDGKATGPGGNAQALAIDASGRIVVAGYSRDDVFAESDFALARYLPSSLAVASTGGPYSVPEGTASIVLDASRTTDPDQPNTTLTYVWDLDNDGLFAEIGADAANGDERGMTPTFRTAGLDGPSSRLIYLRVIDSEGLSTIVVGTIVNITNVAPTVNAGGPVTLPQGGTLVRTVSFTDPGPDFWGDTVDYGDGTIVNLPINPDKTFTLNHTYVSPGVYTVAIGVGDDDGTLGTATFIVTVLAPPTIQGVVVNDGSAQRSMVTRLTVTFNRVVTLDPGAFQVLKNGGEYVNVLTAASVVGGRTVAVLTFAGADVNGGSLADGNYTLITRSARIHDGFGQALDGNGDGAAGDDHLAQFFRLYGDTDGDRDVDNLDYDVFRDTYRKRAGDAGFLWYLDFDGDGDVDTADRAQFMQRRGTVLNP